jgi:methionyl-tRNA formyltransferase
MEKKDLRIVFMGTPEFAVGTLSKLVEGGYNVVAVVTQPDKPVGRHQNTLHASEVKKFALEHHIPVLQPVKMKDPAFVEELRSFHADLQVVVAFRMLPEVVWAMPPLGTFNVHAALLPLYRGAAPINWAVINGETQTGVTTFFLDHDIDTGKIILQKTFDIPEEANVEYVYDGLMELGAEAAIETIELVLKYGKDVPAIPQSEIVAQLAQSQHTTPDKVELKPAPKIFKETCQIDWTQKAKHIHDLVRGLSPYPGAWTTLEEQGRRTVMKVFDTQQTQLPLKGEKPGTLISNHGHLYIAAKDAWLEINELQMAGKKRMTAQAFLNGARDITAYQAIHVESEE